MLTRAHDIPLLMLEILYNCYIPNLHEVESRFYSAAVLPVGALSP
jgi:hypothetical protein